jgi:hypothetical protein
MGQDASDADVSVASHGDGEFRFRVCNCDAIKKSSPLGGFSAAAET